MLRGYWKWEVEVAVGGDDGRDRKQRDNQICEQNFLIKPRP